MNEAKNVLLEEYTRLKAYRSVLNTVFNELNIIIHEAEKAYNAGNSLEVYNALKLCKGIKIDYTPPAPDAEIYKALPEQKTDDILKFDFS